MLEMTDTALPLPIQLMLFHHSWRHTYTMFITKNHVLWKKKYLSETKIGHSGPGSHVWYSTPIPLPRISYFSPIEEEPPGQWSSQWFMYYEKRFTYLKFINLA